MKKLLLLSIILIFVSCAEKPVNENEINFMFRGAAIGTNQIQYQAEKKMKEIVEAALPGITFNLTPIVAPEGEYFTKVALAIRNDSSYDVVSEDSFILESDVVAGLLAPLPIEGWDDWTNFYESGRIASKINGEVYTIPWNSDVRGIYYSLDLLKKQDFLVIGNLKVGMIFWM